ncbi:MAG: DNA polymerase I, partial [Oscillospiraceae bacterium]|nr:DNA polymerase I [Oscillospiraceae bacterium]
REFFVAPEGRVLVDADYSQIELRVLAHVANDKAMQEAFKSGADIHTATAARVYGLPEMMITPELRRSAKAVNFGIVYGIGAYSLSQDIKTSVAEASRLIKSYLDGFAGVADYMKKTVENGERDGFVSTLFNRRRFIPELRNKNKVVHALGERIAMNTPIQGTAADIIKIAMNRVYRALKEKAPDAKLILQVHDELIVECADSDKDKVRDILVREMRSAASLKVELETDVHIGKTWLEAKG